MESVDLKEVEGVVGRMMEARMEERIREVVGGQEREIKAVNLRIAHLENQLQQSL